MSERKALLVYAHPEPRSFTAALKDRAVTELTALGYAVIVSDLYADGWNAILGPKQFEGHRQDPGHFRADREQEHAFASGVVEPDVAREQQRIADAELIVFHFPMWWFSAPAILKGWVDRVFSRGFAYSSGRKYSRGHFVGKRALVVVTTGTADTLYEANGIDGHLLHVLWPIHNGILAYTGFTVLPPFAAWQPTRTSPNEREAYLDALGSRLRGLETTEPLFFHPLEDFDETERLHPGVQARSGVQWNPTTGQGFVDAARSFTTDASMPGADHPERNLR